MSRILTAHDDAMVHQTSEPLRHLESSDPNFFERHYFSLSDFAGGPMVVAGLGEYPNLATTDAFLAVRTAGEQRVLRASEPLAERGTARTGPFRIEVLRGLHSLRLVVEETEGISADLTWQGAHTPQLEPKQFGRVGGRVKWDVTRFGQLGSWTGSLAVDGTMHNIDGWRGFRDRSWGLRPVGPIDETETRRPHRGPGFLWSYCAAHFDDFSIMLKIHELEDGRRPMQEAVRIWHDPERGVEKLGRMTYELEFGPVRNEIIRTTYRAERGDFSMQAEQIQPLYLHLGTGYGDHDATWRHGMPQPAPVAEAVAFDLGPESSTVGTMIDSAGRFVLHDGSHGVGLYEYGIVGNFPAAGIRGRGYWNEGRDL